MSPNRAQQIANRKITMARRKEREKLRRDWEELHRSSTRCRVCGCTEADGCPEGCSWVDDDLCSICASAAEAIAAWIYGARRANKTALWREAVGKLERETR